MFITIKNGNNTISLLNPYAYMYKAEFVTRKLASRSCGITVSKSSPSLVSDEITLNTTPEKLNVLTEWLFSVYSTVTPAFPNFAYTCTV